MDRKGWEKVKNKLPKRYKWEVQYAIRKNKKGRAMGELLVGIKKEEERRNRNGGGM